MWSGAYRGAILQTMSRGQGPVDRRGFAVRREVRDLLGHLLGGQVPPALRFDDALDSLGRRRKIALRQLLRFLVEGRVVDEIAALEILGRLSEPEDEALLARMVNSADLPEAARVTCGLVLLGHDRADLIAARDVSGLVLRWQARFVAEEPSLRTPLMRLYAGASRSERASWSALQDRELSEPEGRAAVFEMLLEVEEDPDLRGFLLEALSRVASPASRAALRRIEPQGPEERDIITGALAALAAAADAESVPVGWSARLGYCDGTGSFPLRFDFRRAGRRPRSAVFVLNHETGVREALALSGAEVQRYDDLGADSDGHDEASTLMYPISVPEALGLLVDAERGDRREGRRAPRDHDRARRLLDPLADLRPRLPDPMAGPFDDEDEARRSPELLEHPGYAGWFYDAGDRLLDGLRVEALRTRGGQPGEALVTRAAEALARAGEPRRLMRMLRHNALVHRAAGEPDRAALALATAAAVGRGQFAQLGLVRRMVSESLHPGHYFLAPVPDLPERAEMAAFLLDGPRPSRQRVLAIDLGIILSRALEVWSSRVPSRERPHSDQSQLTIASLAEAGARLIAHWAARADEAAGRGVTLPGTVRERLHRRYAVVLAESGLPTTAADPGFSWLLDLLVRASADLVERVCLGSCPERCPRDPKAPARNALRAGVFPAGCDAESFLRNWPGAYVHEPTAVQRRALEALARATTVQPASKTPGATFACALCGDERAVTARSRAQLVAHDRSTHSVCRRCRERYRRDPVFRAEIIASRGRLV